VSKISSYTLRRKACVIVLVVVSSRGSRQKQKAKQNKKMNKKVGVIFLHGLGDRGASWQELSRNKSTHNQIIARWQFPNSPIQAVSCNGGMEMPSWFDIDRIPVTETENDHPNGLDESIQLVHALMDEMSGNGIDRIILGGFSQGGAMAQIAGLTYGKRLAGIVSFSGWLMRRKEMKSIVKHSANRETPFLVCHGESDPVVLHSLGKESVRCLQESGKENVQFKSYPGMQHSTCPQEMRDLFSFMSEIID
jgi:predicted esterase